MSPKVNVFENKLQVLPVLKPEALFLLNDAAEKLLVKGQNLNTQETVDTEEGEGVINDTYEMLNEICICLGELDRGIVSYLHSFLEGRTLTNEEVMICASYFLISKQIGPDSRDLRDSLYQGMISCEVFSKKASIVPIPTATRDVLIRVYEKIYPKNFEEGVMA